MIKKFNLKNLSLLALAGLGLTIAACASFELTEAGKKVDVIVKEEAPKGYKYIGDVTNANEGTCPTDMTKMKNQFRNRAAEQGGDVVVIDTVVIRTACHEGSGRVFRKP